VLEGIHAKGYVHRDIKPANICMGLGTYSTTLYLVDFGSAKRYWDQKAQRHVKAKDPGAVATAAGKLQVGNPRFNSPAVQKASSFGSRRDDLISSAYVLINFAQGSLPWSAQREDLSQLQLGEQDNVNALIWQLKTSTPVSKLCENLFFFFEYLTNIAFEMKFEESCQFRLLNQMLSTSLSSYKDLSYDW
jgi:casein kinase 1